MSWESICWVGSEASQYLFGGQRGWVVYVGWVVSPTTNLDVMRSKYVGTWRIPMHRQYNSTWQVLMHQECISTWEIPMYDLER